MEVDLMKLDTRPDGDKNVRVLGPGDWGDGGAININLIHSLIDSSTIHIMCPVLCASLLGTSGKQGGQSLNPHRPSVMWGKRQVRW